MLIVFPICEKEVPLAEKLCSHVARLGGVGSRAALVVGTKSTQGKLDKVVETLATCFGSVSTHILESEDESGWPRSANHLFTATAAYLDSIKNQHPWYYFEADNTPLVAGWADQVEEEYRLSQKPFMGAVQPAKIRDAKTGEELGTDGEFIIGSAVYPADFTRRSIIWRYLSDVPWDVHMRWEIRPNACASNRIFSNWRSVGYSRSADGRIVCDPLDDRSVTDPIPETAVVVHGCKDGSLIDLLSEPPAKKKK